MLVIQSDLTKIFEIFLTEIFEIFFLWSIIEIAKQLQDVHFKLTIFYWNIIDLW